VPAFSVRRGTTSVVPIDPPKVLTSRVRGASRAQIQSIAQRPISRFWDTGMNETRASLPRARAPPQGGTEGAGAFRPLKPAANQEAALRPGFFPNHLEK
jgi:hypothetical protein